MNQAADVSVEAGYKVASGAVTPARVRMDTWSEGDGASLYLTPKAARDLSAALATAADAAEAGTTGKYGEFEWE